MKNIPLQVSLFLIVFVCAHSLAEEPGFHLDFALIDGPNSASETPVPLAPKSDHFADFFRSLNAAIESRDLGAIMALYETNGVTTEASKVELARWRDTLPEDTKQRVTLFGKDLKALPSEGARNFWGERARRLTKREVTHLVFVQIGTEIRLTLPLILVNDRLLIVPSDA